MEKNQIIYFDNSATTKPCDQAVSAIHEMLVSHYGNPSSLHTLGFEAEQQMSQARRAIADQLGVKTQEIIFTSGGTEANNIALFGAVQAKRRRGGRIVTTQIEHPAVSNVMEQLQKQGWEIIPLKPDSFGHILPDQLFEAVTPDTILVSLMAVNNEVGTILPVEAAAAAIARTKAPALLHVDAVQAFGKIPLHPQRLKVDLMTISAHKIHGPKGVGALYISEKAHIPPLVFGGGQEKNLRPGTEATPLIAGFGAAVRALPNLQKEQEKIQLLCEKCRQGLMAIEGITLNSPADALPYIINFSAGSVRAETMLHYLSSQGIFVSSGSACSKAKPSPVLSAMGLSKERILSSLRVSFSRFNTEEEVDVFLAALRKGMQTLARRSIR